MAAAAGAVDLPHFTAAVRGGGPTAVLVIAGELDIASDEAVHAAARVLRAHPGAVSVDLSGLSFVDVGGLRVLSRLKDDAAAAGTSLSLVGVTPLAQRVMDLVGFSAWWVAAPADGS